MAKILKKLLDESLTNNNTSSIYINKTKYKIYHGRIVEMVLPNGDTIVNSKQLMERSIEIYRQVA